MKRNPIRWSAFPLLGGCLTALGMTFLGCAMAPPGDGDDDAHADIVLKDRMGISLTAASKEPYSPRQTCGGCHDIDDVANGYHFQQGRTDLDGTVVTADNFFADGRTWLKSDGMYGKW